MRVEQQGILGLLTLDPAQREPKLEGEHIALLEEEVEEVGERVGLGHKPARDREAVSQSRDPRGRNLIAAVGEGEWARLKEKKVVC